MSEVSSIKAFVPRLALLITVVIMSCYVTWSGSVQPYFDSTHDTLGKRVWGLSLEVRRCHDALEEMKGRDDQRESVDLHMLAALARLEAACEKLLEDME